MAFSERDIQSDEQRRKMASILANQNFRMTVQSILGRDSWELICGEFSEPVYCKRSRLQDQATDLKSGDVVVCRVTTQRKLNQSTGWQFSALAVRRLVDTDGRSFKRPLPTPQPVARLLPKGKGIKPPLDPDRPIPKGIRINKFSILRTALKALLRSTLKPDAPPDLPWSIDDPIYGALVAWRPGTHSRGALLALQKLVCHSLSPGCRIGPGQLYLSCLDQCVNLPAEVLPGLQALLQTHFVNLKPDVPAVESAAAEPAPATERAPVEAASHRVDQSQQAVRRKEAAPKSRSRSWGTASALRVDSWDQVEPLYTLYIDESWPVGSRKGILGGIVWRGTQPDPAILPVPRQHQRNPGAMAQALENLRNAASHALPFIVEYTPPDGMTRIEAYERMLHDLLLLLLGWVIPRPPVTAGKVACVQVVCESLNEFADAHEQTDVLRGVLLQAGRFAPERYGCWGISKLVWRQKTEKSPANLTAGQLAEQGYLGMADLLCYVAQQDTLAKARQIASASNLATLRTWFRLDVQQVKLLDRAEQAVSEPELAALMALLDANRDTCLFDRLVDNLSHRAARDSAFVEGLHRMLDQFYRQKNPDLRRLDRLFSLVSKIGGPLGTEAPLSLQLAALAAALKHGNHFGDPLSDHALADHYLAIRARALENGLAEQVAHVDLNRAVRFRDRFEADLARQIDVALQEQALRFSLRTRAKILSSLGQDHAMLGEEDAADQAFAAALELIDQAEMAADIRDAEWDQTAVYRAVAAIDANNPHAMDYVEAVLLRAGLGDLHAATGALASTNRVRHQYRHYLLLRLLIEKPELAAIARHYLDNMAPFEHVTHPWGLIAFYRGLLLWPANTDAACGNWDQAISICLQPKHGATLRALAAMIATVVAHLTGQAEASLRALQLIEGDDTAGQADARAPLADLLPALATSLGYWREVLQGTTAGEGNDRDIRRVLPFTYR